MFATGENWQNWMKDYRFGTLVYIPNDICKVAVEILRKKYDPTSAQTSMAHITITQPFAKAPTSEEILQIQKLILNAHPFKIKIGPVTSSPNKRLLWLDVAPSEKILSLRESLHCTGLFRTDLPLTRGFIPHMTISEKGREPNEVDSIVLELNKLLRSFEENFNKIAWIVPNADFVFNVKQEFERQ